MSQNLKIMKNHVKNEINVNRNRGLRALAGLLLQGRISKAAQVSNWARPELDDKQVRYAATDAWISREIYLQAVSERDN